MAMSSSKCQGVGILPEASAGEERCTQCEHHSKGAPIPRRLKARPSHSYLPALLYILLETNVPLRTPIQVDRCSTWEVLEDGRLFCSGCGVFQEYFSAYLLSRDGAVEQLPNMLTERCLHRVIQILHINIFGGCKL